MLDKSWKEKFNEIALAQGKERYMGNRVADLKKDGDHYIVDEFDRVGDGSDYAEDIERICDGNKALKEQYFSATDAGKEPLKTRRLWYISNYVKDNGLDITAYQDYGWEPVKLSETENWDMKKELTW